MDSWTRSRHQKRTYASNHEHIRLKLAFPPENFSTSHIRPQEVAYRLPNSETLNHIQRRLRSRDYGYACRCLSIPQRHQERNDKQRVPFIEQHSLLSCVLSISGPHKGLQSLRHWDNGGLRLEGGFTQRRTMSPGGVNKGNPRRTGKRTKESFYTGKWRDTRSCGSRYKSRVGDATTPIMTPSRKTRLKEQIPRLSDPKDVPIYAFNIALITPFPPRTT